MISIHEKLLQYFIKHNMGNDIKLTSNDDEEDKNKHLKTQQTSESEVTVDTNSTSELKDGFIKKLRDYDEQLQGAIYGETLKTINYTPLTEEEIKQKASEGMDEKYELKINELANQTAKKLSDIEKSNEALNHTAKEQKEMLDVLYKDAEEKVEQSAVKRGISRSSIVQEQIKGLGVEKIKDLLSIDQNLATELKNNSDKISELESDYLFAINKLNVEKALEISQEIQDLTEKQNKKIEDVLKYNNTVKRQRAQMKEKTLTEYEENEKLNIERNMVQEALNYYLSLPKEQALSEFDSDYEVRRLLGRHATLVRRYIKGGNY